MTYNHLQRLSDAYAFPLEALDLVRSTSSSLCDSLGTYPGMLLIFVGVLGLGYAICGEPQ